MKTGERKISALLPKKGRWAVAAETIKPVPLGVVGVVEGPRPTGPAMEDHVGYGRAVVR